MGGLPFFSFLFSYASVLNTCISIVHVHVYICFYTRICTLLWCTCMLRLWDLCIYACTCSLLVCVYTYSVSYIMYFLAEFTTEENSSRKMYVPRHVHVHACQILYSGVFCSGLAGAYTCMYVYLYIVCMYMYMCMLGLVLCTVCIRV